jgi:hypothetical protein
VKLSKRLIYEAAAGNFARENPCAAGTLKLLEAHGNEISENQRDVVMKHVRIEFLMN